MAAEQLEIRTLLASVSGGEVLLPGSVVAEVIDYSEPQPYLDMPTWLLGEVGWNDWSVPVISFGVMAGKSTGEEASNRHRILVVKSLSESARIPYIGILISGVPRLLKVTAASLTKPKKLPDHPCVFREITIGEQQALIPDLDELSRLTDTSIVDQPIA